MTESAAKNPTMPLITQLRRVHLLKHIKLGERGLEIGPFCHPTVFKSEADVYYLDWKTREKLIEESPNEPDLAQTVEIDFLVSSNDYRQAVPGTFDYIIANHVLEHVPNLIQWLSNLGDMLNLGGIIFLALPDRKFTFDKYRPSTRLSHFLADHYDGVQAISRDHWLESEIFYDLGFSGQPMQVSERLDRSRLEGILAGTPHIGYHCHVFESGTALDAVFKPLIAMGYLGYDLVDFIPARAEHGGEMILILRRAAGKGATAPINQDILFREDFRKDGPGSPREAPRTVNQGVGQTGRLRVFDVGFYRGEDTKYYLERGYEVVAFEANPMRCEAGQKLFAKEIASGQLQLHNLGIGTESGQQVDFFIHTEQDEWSTFYREAATNWGPGKSRVIQVPCMTPKEMFARFGCPHYLKSDIEGFDINIADELQYLAEVPPLASFEASDIRLLRALLLGGYRSFKLVDQARVPVQTVREPGTEKVFQFQGGTGPFGDEAEGEWISFEFICYLYNRFVHDPFSPSNPPGHWFDIHASTQPPNLNVYQQRDYLRTFIEETFQGHCGMQDNRYSPKCPAFRRRVKWSALRLKAWS